MPKFNPSWKDNTYVFGGSFDESLIKLSLSHELLDPRKITAVLRRKPTKAYRAGDISENKKRIMNHGMWQIATPWISKVGFEENLDRFLARLPSDKKIWRRLNARYDCRLAVVLHMRTWNRSGQISPKAIGELAARGLKLELDIYYDDDAKLWSEKKKA